MSPIEGDSQGDVEQVVYHSKLFLGQFSFYWDFPNKKVMVIDHLGHHSAVGDICDIVTDDDNVVSFKIKKQGRM